MKGHLPRAYLRVDPNLYSSHPDPGSFLGLLCAAHMQPWRGRFRDLDLIRRAIGKGPAARLLERGDIVLVEGVYYVDGWDEWQEGDFTVGERMRRMREKRNNRRNTTVTIAVTELPQPPSPKPSPPSEASGVRRQALDVPDGSGESVGSTAAGNGSPPTYPLPPDLKTETAIRNERWRNERELYSVVGRIAERENKEPGEVMEHVTAYKRRDGTRAPGRKRPELLRSDEAVEKSLEDAKAWLASLETPV